MVALALSAILSMTIMIISNTAREIYQGTTKKVQTSNRFRLALLTLDRDFSQMIDTMNLEFFSDGRGSGARKNKVWDEGEELPDKKDAYGKGVVDGGVYDEYDEYGSVTERYYMGLRPGLDPNNDDNWKRHSAFQAYFRTLTYIDGEVREANVEYKLVDPNKDNAPPDRVQGVELADLMLIKVVRYHDIAPAQLYTNKNFPITRRQVEVCSNVTDFKIEYTVENRFNTRVGAAFMIPSQEFDQPAERDIRPKRVRGGALPVFRKTFGYGSGKIDVSPTKATAFQARQGDRQPSGDHRGVRVGSRQGGGTQFAELVSGSSIFVFREGDRGGASKASETGSTNAADIVSWDANIYTVKSNVGGQLEFYQDIDSTMWGGDAPGLLYKAAFLPSSFRITVRVVDDKALTPKTLQRVIWVRRKAR
jgi:hypothetical protein